MRGTGDWRMGNGEWRMENGEWRRENGEWRMEKGEWRKEKRERVNGHQSQNAKKIPREKSNFLISEIVHFFSN